MGDEARELREPVVLSAEFAFAMFLLGDVVVDDVAVVAEAVEVDRDDGHVEVSDAVFRPSSDLGLNRLAHVERLFEGDGVVPVGDDVVVDVLADDLLRRVAEDALELRVDVVDDGSLRACVTRCGGFRQVLEQRGDPVAFVSQLRLVFETVECLRHVREEQFRQLDVAVVEVGRRRRRRLEDAELADGDGDARLEALVFGVVEGGGRFVDDPVGQPWFARLHHVPGDAAVVGDGSGFVDAVDGFRHDTVALSKSDVADVELEDAVGGRDGPLADGVDAVAGGDLAREAVDGLHLRLRLSEVPLGLDAVLDVTDDADRSAEAVAEIRQERDVVLTADRPAICGVDVDLAARPRPAGVVEQRFDVSL